MVAVMAVMPLMVVATITICDNNDGKQQQRGGGSDNGERSNNINRDNDCEGNNNGSW